MSLNHETASSAGDTVSSIWRSQFQTTEDISKHAASKTRGRNKFQYDINSVLALVHQTLPRIEKSHLRADRFLGSGSMFHVNREVYDDKADIPITYWVAVKYMRTENRPDKHNQILQALVRELRVITHPELRGHPHIMSALGYGWTDSGSGIERPFLVAPYAEYGTLSELLVAVSMQREVTIVERHDLMLDVAQGLQALHACDFIHGDVKANNVLVTTYTEPLGYTYGPNSVPWTAKIADFGSSMGRKEVEDGDARYTGTSVYNAPEVEGFTLSPRDMSLFEAYSKADVYSFGLLLWEVMEGGQCYLDTIRTNDEALKSKRYTDYLRKLYQGDGEILLEAAVQCCREVQFEENNEKMRNCIEEAMKGCLRRKPVERMDMENLVKVLERNVRLDRPPIVHSLPRLRSGPYKRNKLEVAGMQAYLPLITPSAFVGLANLRLADNFKELRKDGQVFRLRTTEDPPYETRLITFRYRDIRGSNEENQGSASMSVQRVIPSPRPPWHIQKSLATAWDMDTGITNDTQVASAAHMELSVCHLAGFGVEPDKLKVLSHLRQACYGNSTAKAIFARVTAALKETVSTHDQMPSADQHRRSENYFANRVCSATSTFKNSPVSRDGPRISSRVNIGSAQEKALDIITFLRSRQHNLSADGLFISRLQRLEELWNTDRDQTDEGLESLSQRDLCRALMEACKLGIFEVASFLVDCCLSYIGTFGEPTPLHWLIMFPPEQALLLLNRLVLGSEERSSSKLGICAHCLNARASTPTFLPEHAMELFGSPLHFAVRSRNIHLTKALLDLGADPNVRFQVSPNRVGEPPPVITFAYTPLEIALEYHLYEIVEVILTRLGNGSSEKEKNIGISLIARFTTPFARYIVHGSSHRVALKRTIGILEHHGFELHAPDFFGPPPLLVALQNTSQENYVIEELLSANATLAKMALPDGETLASFVVRSAESNHIGTVWKLEKVLPLVKDINATDDSGHNALHYSALVDNVAMAESLLRHENIDIDMKSRNKHQLSALMIASMIDRTGIARLLIKANAKLDLTNSKGSSALDIAISNRQLDTASALIEKGAATDFRVHDWKVAVSSRQLTHKSILEGASFDFEVQDRTPEDTALHAACIQFSNRPPIVKSLLARHEGLRSKEVVTRFCGKHKTSYLWSPLHNAVYYADLESVEALLTYGADPNAWAVPHSFLEMDPFSLLLEKRSARDLVENLLRKAERNRLDFHQLKVARAGEPHQMRNVPFAIERDRELERAQFEQLDGTKQYDYRLEAVQEEKHGQAGIRALVTRLREMKRLMDEKVQRDEQGA